MILIVGGASQTRVCRDVWLFSVVTSQWTEVIVHNQYPHDFAPNNDDFPYLPFTYIASSRILVTFGRLKRHPSEHQRHIYSRFDYSHWEKCSREEISVVRSSSSDESDETTRRSLTQRRMNLPSIDRKYHLIDLSTGLQIYRLDLSTIFDCKPSIRWLPSKCTSVFGSPTRSSLFYSLVYTRSELILFGGIEKRKLLFDRRTIENPESSLSSHRTQSMEGTLAFITVSNIPL